MSKHSKFDLGEEAAPARILSDEERAIALAGFIEIPEDKWPSINGGARVKYDSKTKGFRHGGIVTSNPTTFTPKGKSEEITVMWLESMATKTDGKKMSWSVSYDELISVYVKPSVEYVMLMERLETAINTLKENQQILATEIANRR